MPLTKEENDRRLWAYRTYGSFNEAAVELGMNRSAFYYWAKRRGLALKKGSRLFAKEHDRRLQIIEDSNSIPEAAEKMGITEVALYKWRRRSGIDLPERYYSQVYLQPWQKPDWEITDEQKEKSYVNDRPEREREIVRQVVGGLESAVKRYGCSPKENNLTQYFNEWREIYGRHTKQQNRTH